jgi:hypothetical protein
MANDVANFLGFEGELQSQCAEQVLILPHMFLQYPAGVIVLLHNESAVLYRKYNKILFHTGDTFGRYVHKCRLSSGE